MILNRVKEIRKELHMTVRELAEKSELSHSTISDLENGISTANHVTMLLVCKGLNMRFEDVFETDPSVLDSYFGRNADHTQ